MSALSDLEDDFDKTPGGKRPKTGFHRRGAGDFRNKPICVHTFADGGRCKAPASQLIAGQMWCHHHAPNIGEP